MSERCSHLGLGLAAILTMPAVAQAQGTSIAGLLATGYELKAAVAVPGGEALYFEGRPGGSGAARQIYRCFVSAPKGGAGSADASCVQVR